MSWCSIWYMYMTILTLFPSNGCQFVTPAVFSSFEAWFSIWIWGCCQLNAPQKCKKNICFISNCFSKYVLFSTLHVSGRNCIKHFLFHTRFNPSDHMVRTHKRNLAFNKPCLLCNIIVNVSQFCGGLVYGFCSIY